MYRAQLCRDDKDPQSHTSKYRSIPVHRHDLKGYNGEEQKYITRILATERNLLPLVITECLYIEKQYTGSSFNDRNDNCHCSIVRLIPQR